MSDAASCPKCYRQVLIPLPADPTAWVRCPLCGASYELKQAIDYTPPELEVVDRPTELQYEAPGLSMATAAATTGEAGLQPGGDAFRMEVPEDDVAEIDFADEPRWSAGTETAGELTDDGEFSPAGEGQDQAFNLAETTRALEIEDQDTQPMFDGDPATISAGGFAAGADSEDSFTLAPSESGVVDMTSGQKPTADRAAPVASVARKKKPQKSGVRTAAEVVGGGVAGLAIAYFAMLWGLKRDPLPQLTAVIPAAMVPTEIANKRNTAAPVANANRRPAPGGSGPADGGPVLEPPQTSDGGNIFAPGGVDANAEGFGQDPADATAPTATGDDPATPPSDSGFGDMGTPAGDAAMPADGADAADPGIPDFSADPLADPLSDPGFDIAPPTIAPPTVAPPGDTAPATDATETTDSPAADAGAEKMAADPLAPPSGLDVPSSPDETQPTEEPTATTADPAEMPADAAATPMPSPFDLPDVDAPESTPSATTPPAADTQAITVRDAPEVTEASLQQAASAAVQAKPAYDAAQLAGASLAAKAPFYVALADYAQEKTFAPADADANEELQEVLNTIADKPAQLADIGKLGAAWMTSKARKGNGIVLTGTLEKSNQLGAGYQSILRLPNGREVTVLSSKQPSASEGGEMLVLGSLVANPSENLVGVPEGESVAAGETGMVVLAGQWWATGEADLEPSADDAAKPDAETSPVPADSEAEDAAPMPMEEAPADESDDPNAPTLPTDGSAAEEAADLNSLPLSESDDAEATEDDANGGAD